MVSVQSLICGEKRLKLIDADALFINLDGMMAVSPTGYIHGDTVADMISDAPTVDAVPVIRCKDCKHFGKPACPMVFSLPIKSEQRTSGWVETFRNGADDYCSRAERKEE